MVYSKDQSDLTEGQPTKVGVVNIETEEKNGKRYIRLRWSYKGNRKAISLGRLTSANSYKAAVAKATMIDGDIHWNRYDETLDRYFPDRKKRKGDLKLVRSGQEPSTHTSLKDLWPLYVESRKGQVAETTMQGNYKQFGARINELPTALLTDAMQIKEHLIKMKGPKQAKRLVTQFNACCYWAKKKGWISENPFEGMADDIKIPKGEAGEFNDIDPFTKEERDIIIEAFDRHKLFYVYVPFVKFLFFTGCRPSEAKALTWNDIGERELVFNKGLVEVSGKQIHKKGTKTGKPRRFPINDDLREILESVPGREHRKGSDLVFTVNGKPIVQHSFNRAWYGQIKEGIHYGGIVTKLANDGLIGKYRNAYQTRHTFITLARDEAKLPLATIARLVGNSVDIIEKHYGSTTTYIDIPSLK